MTSSIETHIAVESRNTERRATEDLSGPWPVRGPATVFVDAEPFPGRTVLVLTTPASWPIEVELVRYLTAARFRALGLDRVARGERAEVRFEIVEFGGASLERARAQEVVDGICEMLESLEVSERPTLVPPAMKNTG